MKIALRFTTRSSLPERELPCEFPPAGDSDRVLVPPQPPTHRIQ